MFCNCHYMDLLLLGCTLSWLYTGQTKGTILEASLNSTFTFTITLSISRNTCSTVFAERNGTDICVFNYQTCSTVNSMPGYKCQCVGSCGGSARYVTVTVERVQSKDANEWRARYPTFRGSSIYSNIWNLKIQPVAPIVNILGTTYVSEGQTINITCLAYGYPPDFNFRFHHISNVDSSEDNVVSHNGERYTLIIPVATYADSGSYRCVVENGVAGEDGDVERTAVTDIVVFATPRPASLFPDVINVDVGDDVIITAVFINMSKVTLIRWSHDGQTLDNQRHVLVTHNYTLQNRTFPAHLVNTSLTWTVDDVDVGRYEVIVCTQGGCGSQSTQLKIAFPLTPHEFRLEYVSTHNAWFSWLPGFYGRRNHFYFILEIKRSRSEEPWRSQGVEDKGHRVYARVTDLTPGVKYLARVSSRHTRDSGSYSQNSEEIVFQMQEFTDPPSNVKLIKGVGLGVWFGLAIVTTVNVVMIIWVLHPQHIYTEEVDSSERNSKNDDCDRVDQLELNDVELTCQISDTGKKVKVAPPHAPPRGKPVIASPGTMYDQLDERQSESYEGLELYEN